MPVLVLIADIQDALASSGEPLAQAELKMALNANNRNVAAPIPDIGYIRLLARQNPEPTTRAGNPNIDRRSVAYSQITWKPVDDGERSDVPDFVLARSEDSYFQ
jgi:hypothetical protein